MESQGDLLGVAQGKYLSFLGFSFLFFSFS